MEATHVLFARDLENSLSVSNRKAYFGGAVYPDSRYATGIHRHKTHDIEVPTDPFDSTLSDFEKGWATHILYDRFGSREGVNLLLKSPDLPDGNFNGAWVEVTAMKFIEDRRAFELLGPEIDLLINLQFTQAPRGEDAKILETYAKSFKNLYKQRPEPEHYFNWLISGGVNSAVVERVIRKMKELLKDKRLVERIYKIYPKALKKAEKMV